MAIKRGKFYLCGYCKQPYSDPFRADKCRDGHELIYVPLSKTDLNRLINFIYLKQDQLLTKSLIDTLTSYMKGSTAPTPTMKYEEFDRTE